MGRLRVGFREPGRRAWETCTHGWRNRSRSFLRRVRMVRLQKRTCGAYVGAALIQGSLLESVRADWADPRLPRNSRLVRRMLDRRGSQVECTKPIRRRVS